MTEFWESYTDFVKNHAFISAALHFAILGTLGECISLFLRNKKIYNPYTLSKWLGVILAWAVLGIIIKYGFIGMHGFVDALLTHKLLPPFFASGIFYAFAVSVATNTFFGPQMMAFHRLEENLIHKRWDFSGITTAWKTLVWFWIPAHTLTFSLPKDYQIALAACWSIVLGLILGFAAPRKPQETSKP